MAAQSAPLNMAIVSPEYCNLLDNAQAVIDKLCEEQCVYTAGEPGYHAIRLQSATKSHPQFPIFGTALGCLPSPGNGHIPPLHVYVSTCTTHTCISTACADVCIHYMFTRGHAPRHSIAFHPYAFTYMQPRGLTIELWGDADPASMSVFNCNYSQARIATLHTAHTMSRRVCIGNTYIYHTPTATRLVYMFTHAMCLSPHRKSRLVKLAENLHRPVDEHMQERFNRIQAAKERAAFEMRREAGHASVARLSGSCMYTYRNHTSIC